MIRIGLTILIALAFSGLPVLAGQGKKAVAEKTVVVLETELGVIEIAVDGKNAPVTAVNFLRYVKAGHYDGGRFHRTVRTNPDNQPGKDIKIDVIQGGVNPDKAKSDFAAVPLERTNKTGLKHLNGTVSMARAGADTATSDFFICIGNQPELDFGGKRNPDGQGFAAFGKVIRGMEVVQKIHRSNAEGQSLKPPVSIIRAYLKA